MTLKGDYFQIESQTLLARSLVCSLLSSSHIRSSRSKNDVTPHAKLVSGAMASMARGLLTRNPAGAIRFQISIST